MARRPQKPARSAAVDTGDRRVLIERLLEQGKEKEAFKEAKFHFHHEPSPENRHFVERTYVKRIQAMVRGGMTSAGREIALSMLEFGVTDPALMQEVVVLLPHVGLSDKALALQGQIQSPETKAQLSGALADQAVLHPNEIQASAPVLYAEAGPVRQAFAVLDAGNDAQALELLQSIPRSSPLADWRMLVRGLAAFRNRDLEQAKANWERLDPRRAAHKIARALLALSERPESRGHFAQLRSLERAAFGESVLEPLAKLRQAMDATEWKEVLAQVGPLRRALHRIDPRLAQRLTEIMMSALSVDLVKRPYDEAARWVHKFKAVLEPLPWDPNWNRFIALMWDRPGADPEGAIQFWKLYLDDLDRGVAAPFGGLKPIKALVWRRIGRIYGERAEPEDAGPFGPEVTREDKAQQEEFRTKAVDALQQSIRLDPAQHRTYQILVDYYADWDQPEKLVAALDQLLQAHPEDVEAWRQLIDLRQTRDEPELMLSHIKSLRALRPLGSALDNKEIWARFALARHLALKQRWEEGRAEFAHIEQSATLRELDPAYRFFTRRAAFELKAGEAAIGEEYIARARAAPHEPAALWLALAIESDRFQLPVAHGTRFNQEFTAALVGKASSAVAGALAATLTGYFVSQIKYPSRDFHVQQILRYLKRTTRIKYQERDLRLVCMLLKTANEDEQLVRTLTRRGLKLFPHSPFYSMLDAEEDLREGPFGARNPRSIEKKLVKALTLAEASKDPGDVPLIAEIKEILGRVRDVGEIFSRFPFGGGRMPRSPADFREMMDNLFGFNDDDDDDDDFDEPSSRKPRKRKPK